MEKNFWKKLWAPQCQQGWRDRSLRGRGNRAARRAIATLRGQEHIRDMGEDIYTDRPEILTRGACLIARDSTLSR